MVARTLLNVTLYVHYLFCYNFSSTQCAYWNACIMLLIRWLQFVKQWIERSKSPPHHPIILRCINGAADKAYLNMWIRHFLLCHIGIERKRPLGKPRSRREDNIKMDLQEVVWGHGLDWSGSGYGQVTGTCECGDEPSVSIKCGDFLD